MPVLLKRPGRIQLFSDGRQVELTPRVAAFCEVSEADARMWAFRHRVQRTARAYLWSQRDVEAFLRDLSTAAPVPAPDGNDAA